MVTSVSQRKLESLLAAEAWEEARTLIEKQLKRRPKDHWLVTQLGVTYYEERQYEKSRQIFERSKEIVDDCPLTLWNLAGAFDALKEHDAAIRLYTELINSDVSPSDDPCWESQEWRDSLITDCYFRKGICLNKSKKWNSANICFRTFSDRLFDAKKGIYSFDDAQPYAQDARTHLFGTADKRKRGKLIRAAKHLDLDPRFPNRESSTQHSLEESSSG